MITCHQPPDGVQVAAAGRAPQRAAVLAAVDVGRRPVPGQQLLRGHARRGIGLAPDGRLRLHARPVVFSD